MKRTLVVVRHAKSDWTGDHADRDRPLNSRGRHQAAEAGAWLAAHAPWLQAAVVSPAARSRTTWDLIAVELRDAPPVRVAEAAYSFDGGVLLDLVRDLDPACEAVVLVGHNPAVAALVSALTGEDVAMPTACVAVLEWEGSWDDPRDVALVAHGRPPEQPESPESLA
jgi:phosphohistidine phosphatase